MFILAQEEHGGDVSGAYVLVPRPERHLGVADAVIEANPLSSEAEAQQACYPIATDCSEGGGQGIDQRAMASSYGHALLQ